MQGRGGIGIIAMDTSDRNGEVVNLCLVTPNEQFMCITNGGQVIRTEVSQVREVGRNTQGVRVMTLDENERVVDVAKVAEQDEEARERNGDGKAAEGEGEGGVEDAAAEPAPAVEAEDVDESSDEGGDDEA